MEWVQRGWLALQRWWDVWSIPFLPESLRNFEINLVATVMVAVVLGLAAGPIIGVTRWRAAIWSTCVLTPLAYTLSATGTQAADGCSIGLTPWQFPGALFATDSRANILMLIPAGAAAFLFPAGPKRLAALLVALSVPQPIELVQLVATHLGRSCQLFDVVNNMVGVLMGFWMVAGVLAIRQSIRSLRPPLSADP